ncbi:MULTISPECIES: hypothetical protein [Cryobacterium]|uniref:hypothetical protein n=1 Tax=Cryobacterium TaxID=69578 RepID=UPI001580BA6F|nr:MULTISPECIES: hypothetical protein [Cryobacterium]
MIWRRSLLVLQAFLAVTSFAGGLALILGPAIGGLGITPPPEYLAGTPFDSYLVPGLILFLVVGGTHLAAFLLLWRRNGRAAAAAAAAAGFGLLIWVFVQMVIIPFSVLQAVYFGFGLLELVLVLLSLDVVNAPDALNPRSEQQPTLPRPGTAPRPSPGPPARRWPDDLTR